VVIVRSKTVQKQYSLDHGSHLVYAVIRAAFFGRAPKNLVWYTSVGSLVMRWL
jgi:hypothetical protein